MNVLVCIVTSQMGQSYTELPKVICPGNPLFEENRVTFSRTLVSYNPVWKMLNNSNLSQILIEEWGGLIQDGALAYIHVCALRKYIL